MSSSFAKTPTTKSSSRSSASSFSSFFDQKKIATTQVYHTADGAPYVICNSTNEFVNPTSSSSSRSDATTLNLTLGTSFLTWRSATSPFILRLLEICDTFLVSWWIPVFFYIYSELIPAAVKRAVIFTSWKYYLALHKAILYKRTGLHPSLSAEYHALTTLLWWAQFCVITPERIQFSLGELYVVSPTPLPRNEELEEIRVDQTQYLQSRSMSIPESHRRHCTVRGVFVHCRGNNKHDHGLVSSSSTTSSSSTNKKKRIIIWLYGGAYLGGDCRGNTTVAQEFGNDTGCDGVFIPHFRLAPAATLDDVLWDVCLAYQWACRAFGVDSDASTQITLMGPSSGGGLALRLMQLISERQRNQPVLPSSVGPLLDLVQQPHSAVLFGPYIDYTEPKRGSFLHYAKHDLIVTEAVQHYGLPFLNDFIPQVGDIDKAQNYNGQGRKEYSPIYRPFKGLPPLCFVVSEHEACYDMTIQAVNRARAQGVDVTVGVWKYMCHVFSFLHAFVPEGKLSIEFAKEWVKQQQHCDDSAPRGVTAKSACTESSTSKKSSTRILFGPTAIVGVFLLALIAWWLPITTAFSGMQIPVGGYSLDRFQSVCPAKEDAVKRFDSSLVDSQKDDADSSSSVWVAVYRSNNNKPSVMVRDEFFHSMTMATSGKSDSDAAASSSSSFLSETRSFLETPSTSNIQSPVAVAQLRPSPDFEDCFILGSLRCSLRKENMDNACDGGSEFLEALGVAVDSLVLHHLQQLLGNIEQGDNDLPVVFEGTLRSKATLFSGKVLEERGFEPVEDLAKDMATHVSRYEACLNQYAERSIPPSVNAAGQGFRKSSDSVSDNTNTIRAVGAQDRALQIVALLGQLDPIVQREAAAKEQDGREEDNYDPWAGINLRR